MGPEVKLEFRCRLKFELCKESRIQASAQMSKQYLKGLNISATVDEPPLRNKALLQDLRIPLSDQGFPQGFKHPLKH